SYVGTTDGNGVASISTVALAKGTYEVTLKFAGTASRYAAATVTKKVSVSKKIPVNMVIKSGSATKSSSTFKISVKDSETGDPVANNKVLLILTGKSYVATTDKNGIATITTKALAKGDYDITLKFAGTATRYEQTIITKKVHSPGVGSITTKVPVKMTVTSASSNDASAVFKVKVTDSETGKAVANSKVLLTLNGKSYVATTDKNGVASITTAAVSMGSYKVTMKHAGTIARYEPTTISEKVTVTYTGKARKVWINADNGSDAMKNAVANLLRKKGWTVHVGETGSNAHYTDYFKVTSDYQYYITLYNGFCAGTVREAYSSSIQNTLKSKGVQLVIMWDTQDWTNPQGMKPYRYGDFTGYNAARAWDDNFSVNDPSINNVAAWLKSNNAFYCASPTADGLVAQFLAGGYFEYSSK
ncbi:hypothetical protein, partial [Methanobrevibacter sp.]|uniref:hypothetical protein n=1 Tax=Methanobrevibacter sp. TaxID=66852 RepID=UPI00388DC7FD